MTGTCMMTISRSASKKRLLYNEGLPALYTSVECFHLLTGYRVVKKEKTQDGSDRNQRWIDGCIYQQAGNTIEMHAK